MLLLDTCSLLWLAAGSSALSKRAGEAIVLQRSNLWVSAISGLEIGIKYKRKRLGLPLPPRKWVPQVLEHHGIRSLPLDLDVCLRAADLPDIHNDPFDRLIVATALVCGMSIVTPDATLQAYPGVTTVW